MPLPRPIQISTDPSVNAAALSAINGAFDLIEGQPWNLVGDPGKPAFVNGWANKGATFSPVGYRKLGTNQVEVRGELTNPGGAGQGSGTVAFTLPAGLAPKTIRTLTVIGSSGGVIAVGRAEIRVNGDVFFSLAGGIAVNAAVGDISLEGVFSVI